MNTEQEAIPSEMSFELDPWEVCRDKDMSVGTQNGITVNEYLDFCRGLTICIGVAIVLSIIFIFPSELIIL